jgi:hypothetical protein
MRWVFGDIHGMLRPLAALVRHIEQEDPAAQFCFVGDYVNKGPDTPGVIDLLLALPPAHAPARFVRGNHDDVLDLLLGGESLGGLPAGERIAAARRFLPRGLDATLAGYGIAGVDPSAEDRQIDYALTRLAAAMPPAHREFLRSLPAVIEMEDVFIAHGFLPLEDSSEHLAGRAAVDAELRRKLIGGAFDAAGVTAPKGWSRTGIFGHRAVAKYPPEMRAGCNFPVTGPRIILLDTEPAAPGGLLTAWCIESGRFRQSDAAGRIRIAAGEGYAAEPS